MHHDAAAGFLASPEFAAGYGASGGGSDETFLEQVGVPQTMTVLPASELAQGLKVESVETTASGVSVVLSGQDVALDNLGK